VGDALARMFVNPAMLLGAAAIAAPIIIFLLSRFRYRTVDWAALVFLQRALKRQQRRLRLENLLLLLIRCLLLILFALALARPRSVGEVVTDPKDARRNVLVAVDTSYSTAYQVGSDEDETVFRRALRAAKDVVAGLSDGDLINVVAFDEGARVLYAKPRQLNDRVRAEVLQDLEDAPELQRSERTTDLAALLHALPAALRAFDFDAAGNPLPAGAAPGEKVVLLLTDAQRAGFLDADGRAYDRTLAGVAEDLRALAASVVLLDCGAEEPKNVAVVRLATRQAVVGRGLPCHVEATVRNGSSSEAKDLVLEYFVDGAERPQKSVSISLGPGEEVTAEPLRYVFRDAGAHDVAVTLRSDALTLDNERHLVVDVREEVRVLLVDGEPSRERWESETDFLREVLRLSEHVTESGQGLVRPEVVDEGQLASVRLGDYDAVFVCNVGTPSEEAAAALERYVRDGGAVVFTVGAQVDAGAYNDALWRDGLGPLPCKLGAARGGTREEAAIDEDAPAWVMGLGDHEGHPVELFASEEMLGWLRSPSVFGFVEAEVAAGGEDAPAAAVPLRVVPRPADDAPDASVEGVGYPLLVERPFGRGRVAVWLSTVDYRWNSCVLFDGFYVPFWRELVLDLAQRRRAASNLPIGGRYEQILPASGYSARVEVETPDGRREAIVLERQGDEEVYRLSFPDDEERAGLERSGLYTIRRVGVAQEGAPTLVDPFAVAVDTREGALARFSADELEVALGLPVQSVSPETARGVLQADGGLTGGSREFWREVVALVVALLALESLLAALFGRRRR